MKTLTHPGRWLAVASATSLLALASSASATLSLQRSGNKLLNNGKPITLISYGTYGSLAEGRIVNASGQLVEEAFDYVSFFSNCQANGVNATRTWNWFHFSNALTPFQGVPKSGSDTNRSGRYTHDLNATFFDRQQAFCTEANNRNIAVMLTLFDAVALESGAADTYSNRWVNCPWRSGPNRSAGALGSPAAFFTSATARALQKQQIDETVRRVGGLGNMIFEPLNEPFSESGASEAQLLAWHKDITAHVKARAPGRLVMINVSTAQPSILNWARTSSQVDILCLHLSGSTTSSQQNTAGWLGYGKIFVLSNDGHNSCGAGISDSTFTKAITEWVSEVRAADKNVDGVINGQAHMEFLSNKLTTHPSAGGNAADYDARASRASSAIWSAFKAVR